MKVSRDAYSVYAVTDRAWLDGRTLAHDVEEILEGGATLLQLREKQLGREDFLAEALEIKEICHRRGVPFIVNDNVEIAAACGADGVHIGQDDMPLAEARRIMGPDACIGVSAQTVAQAIAAEKGGADCIGVGALFPTGTKADAADVPFNEFAAICSAVKIPVVAIGGVCKENVQQLAGSGMAGVAAVSAFFKGGHPRQATAGMAAAIHAAMAVPPRNLAGAIIDLDGTLLDTLAFWDTLAVNFLEKHGIKAEPGLRKTIEQMEMWEVSRYLKEHYDLAGTPEEIADGLRRDASRIYFESAPLKPWARELVEGLHAQGVRMLILSATRKELVEAALKRTGLAPYFQQVISSDDMHLDKREPGAFYYALGQLGTAMARTKVYDDAPFVINGARKAGFHVVGFHEKYWDYSNCEADEWFF